jgi:cobaltochelatase CobN
VIRCLGGLDYWRYGVERCAEAARAHGVVLAVLPGDDRPDPRLTPFSTDPALAEELDGYFRAGGPDNLRQMLRRMARRIGRDLVVEPPKPLPRGFAWCPGCGVLPSDTALASAESAIPFTGPGATLLLVYRSAVLGGDTAPFVALIAALRERGIGVLAMAVSSLKEPDAAAAVAGAVRTRRPDLVIAATAFSAREDGTDFVLDGADCPVLQAFTVGSARAAWEASARGLGAADLAMQVALPEFDGRLSGFPISFKEEAPEVAGFAERWAMPYVPGITALAERAAGWLRLAARPPAERRVAVVLSDYPARGGRAGFAVGLDTPASVRALAADLADAGYAVGKIPDGAPLMESLTAGPATFTVPLDAYAAWLGVLPDATRTALLEAWGAPEADPACVGGAFRFRMVAGTDAGWGSAQPSMTQFQPPPSDGIGCLDRPRALLHPEKLAASHIEFGPAASGSDAGPLSRAGEGQGEGSGLSGRGALLKHVDGVPNPEPSHPSPQPSPAREREHVAFPHRRRSPPERCEDRGRAEGGGRSAETSPSRRGSLAVFLQPDRGRDPDRKAGYHDPERLPTHAYLAFHLGLRQHFDVLVQLGTHGTTEWLPGKAVALSPECLPALCVGGLPVVYPFIVDDPGEAAPLKRRLGGVALGHLTPQTAGHTLSPEAVRLRELVEEYSAASVLDPRRAELIARAILEEAEAAGLLGVAGIAADTPMDEALTRLDAHLCDLGETTFRDGLHVFGRAPDDAPAPVAASAARERVGLLAALDGRFVPPGPSGSPSRGRADVLPTGRNLTTLDPRAIPSRAAALLGARAADAVVTRYLQDEGAYPARIVMDLWASPTLRTGGEDVAHALALMGVRPVWDHASTRVTGFEILPLAMLDRPRIDVTVRISGAFRDTFPDTLALIDRAARAVAERDEADDENPLAAARRRGEAVARVFGAAPGRYGAGVAAAALDRAWHGRADLGRAYLAASTHAYGDREAPDVDFAARVAAADAYLHAFDVAERDLFDGDAAVDAMGGFAAAAAEAGGKPALYSLDVSVPERPKARTAREDAARLIGGRLADRCWIAAQLRHGQRGAQELAQGLDAVFVLAATSDAVTDAGFDRLYGAWIADAEVFERLRAANPAATRAILERFDEARDRGLWHSRRNALPADALMPEAAA